MFSMIITALFLMTGSIGQVEVVGIPSMEECQAAIPEYREQLTAEIVASGEDPANVVLDFQCFPARE